MNCADNDAQNHYQGLTFFFITMFLPPWFWQLQYRAQQHLVKMSEMSTWKPCLIDDSLSIECFETNLSEIISKYTTFHSRICVRKWCLQKSGHFVKFVLLVFQMRRLWAVQFPLFTFAAGQPVCVESVGWGRSVRRSLVEGTCAHVLRGLVWVCTRGQVCDVPCPTCGAWCWAVCQTRVRSHRRPTTPTQAFPSELLPTAVQVLML